MTQETDPLEEVRILASRLSATTEQLTYAPRGGSGDWSYGIYEEVEIREVVADLETRTAAETRLRAIVHSTAPEAVRAAAEHALQHRDRP